MRTLPMAAILTVMLCGGTPGTAGGAGDDSGALTPPTASPWRLSPATTDAAPGLPLASVVPLLGQPVLGLDGTEAGRLEALLVDEAGRVRGAVIAWGGFLGVGQRRAILPIGQLHPAGDGRLRIALGSKQLEALPGFDADNPQQAVRRLGWPSGLRLYR